MKSAKPIPKSKTTGRAGRPTRFPDSVAAAALIGVDYSHLYRVLIGERQSAEVVRRLKAAGHPLHTKAKAGHEQARALAQSLKRRTS